MFDAAVRMFFTFTIVFATTSMLFMLSIRPSGKVEAASVKVAAASAVGMITSAIVAVWAA